MRPKYILFALISVIICSCFEDNGKGYHDIGTIQLRTRNYEKAIETFSKGLSLNDEYANLNYLGRAEAYRRTEKLDSAKQDLLNVLETEKTNPDTINRDTYWRLGWIAETKEEKLELYTKAFAYDPYPHDKRLKMTYGLELIENDSVQKGVDILNGLIDEGFNTAFVFNNRALGLIKLRKYGQASKDLKKSLGMDENNPFVYKNLALLYSKTDQPDLACRHINKALSLDMKKYGQPKYTLEFEELKSKLCL